MNRRLSLLAASVFILALTLACQLPAGSPGRLGGLRGSGNVIEESRDITPIDAVELATLGELIIEIGDGPRLRVEAEDNLIQHLRTEVRDRTLVITNEPNSNLRPTQPVRYYLQVESLERIQLSSSGNARAPELSAGTFTIRVSSSGGLDIAALTCDTCDIRLSSSGGVRIGDLDATAVDVQLSSSGSLTVNGGEVTRQDIRLSSSGSYNAADLRSSEVEARLQSSGSARIWVEDDLRGRLSSSGSLIYRGDPTVDVTTTASGRVRRE